MRIRYISFPEIINSWQPFTESVSKPKTEIVFKVVSYPETVVFSRGRAIRTSLLRTLHEACPCNSHRSPSATKVSGTSPMAISLSSSFIAPTFIPPARATNDKLAEGSCLTNRDSFLRMRILACEFSREA